MEKSKEDLAYNSVRRIIPASALIKVDRADNGIIAVFRDHPANREVLMRLPLDTVMAILVDVGVFAQPVDSYTNTPWAASADQMAFGALWFSEHVDRYSNAESNW